MYTTWFKNMIHNHLHYGKEALPQKAPVTILYTSHQPHFLDYWKGADDRVLMANLVKKIII